MNPDDLDPPKPKSIEPVDLEVLSIDALEEYIEERQAEIKRAQDMIEKKRAARDAAASVFK